MTKIVIGPPQVNQLIIDENENIVIVETPIAATTAIIAQGPQGPQGTTGSGIAIDDVAKINGSLVYYDGIAAKFKADAVWTTTTLTDGGNF